MSAFLCDETHIQQLAAFKDHGKNNWLTFEEQPKNMAHLDALVLANENIVSIQARYSDGMGYSEQELKDYVTDCQKSVRFDNRLTLGDVAGMLHCYEYQACETNGFEKSEAKKLCNEIRYEIVKCSRTASGPKESYDGSNEALWEYTPSVMADREKTKERIKKEFFDSKKNSFSN